MNRKGNALLAGITILVFLFAVSFVLFITKNIVRDYDTSVQSDASVSAKAKEISEINNSRFHTYWDDAIVAVFAFLWIASLVFATMIETRPVFFIATIIGLIIVLMVSIIVENSYDEFVLDESYADMPELFPKVHYLVSRLPFVVFFVVISVAIVLYGKEAIG